MSQITFASNAVPTLPNLDANFTELYNAYTTTGGQGIKIIGGSPSLDTSIRHTHLGNDKIWFLDPAQSANNRQVEFNWSSGGFQGRFVNDSYTAAIPWIAVTGGQAGGVASISFPNGLVGVGNADWAGGRLSVNTSTNTSRSLSAWNSHNSAGSAILARVDFTACRLAEFYYTAGASVGSITTNGTTTAYNTSSDARLKKNVTDAPSAGTLIDALRVVSFDWKSNGEHQRYGFVAQELNAVAPEAVHAGDAVEAMSDDSVIWGVDASKLVPMLVKEVQSLRARLAAAGL